MKPEDVPADYERTYDEFWREMVERPDGSLNLEQIKRELFDFRVVMTEVSKVYYHVTDGMLSKPNTAAHHIISYADDAEEKRATEREQEIREEIADEIEARSVDETHRAEEYAAEGSAAAADTIRQVAAYLTLLAKATRAPQAPTAPPATPEQGATATGAQEGVQSRDPMDAYREDAEHVLHPVREISDERDVTRLVGEIFDVIRPDLLAKDAEIEQLRTVIERHEACAPATNALAQRQRERAEKAEAERDQLKAAVERVRTLIPAWRAKDHPIHEGSYEGCADALEATLDLPGEPT